MLKIKSIALIAAAVTLGATASIAGTRDIHKYGKFFQNVKAEHVKPLLSGSAFVSHNDYDGLCVTTCIYNWLDLQTARF